MVTHVTTTRFGAAALDYLLTEKGHNGHEKRNLLISDVGLNHPYAESYESQMARLWGKASERHEIQVMRLMQSYAKDELDPADPASALIAEQVMQQTIEQAYPGFPAVICVQADGKGGCLHVHAALCDVHSQTYKAPSDAQRKWRYFRDASEAAAKEHVPDLVDPRTRSAAKRVAQAERGRRAEGKYVWKDDLRARIDAARECCYTYDAFAQYLDAHGVAVEQRHSNKYGDYYLYELLDTSGFGEDDKIPSNLRSKSYKLGDDYGPEAPLGALARHRPQPQPVPVMPVPHPLADEDEEEEKPAKRKQKITWNGKAQPPAASQPVPEPVKAPQEPEPQSQPAAPQPQARRLPSLPEDYSSSDDFDFSL